MSDTPRTDAVWRECVADVSRIPLKSLAAQLERELAAANERIAALEKAGDSMQIAANRADDDIREHLQVANYNLHGLLNTGERIEKPSPPQTIHQAGIDASVRVRKMLQESVREWAKAKESKP
jgi:uncharacterized protein YegJ (DUF2314 family)